jgi:chemotaxis protein CheZ
MSRSVNPELMGCLENLKAEGDRKLSARELSEIIDDVARTLTADLGPTADPAETSAKSSEPDSEPDALPEVVTNALEALRMIGDPEKEDGRLAELCCEMDEIRNATQEAAAKFLSVAERIEDIAGHQDMDTGDQSDLYRLATEIYEASGFQDITGQRLTHMAQTLKQVELQIANAEAVLGDDSAVHAAEALSETVEQTETRKMEYILHGPQEAGKANTQEEIDKILASFD